MIFSKFYSKPKFNDNWHSWDPTPWLHPWLIPHHLNELREFSRHLRQHLINQLEPTDIEKYKFAFVGNIANCLYTRSSVLRSKGYQTAVFMHPHETYVMSHPSWEEFDGSLAPEDELTFQSLFQRGIMNQHAVDDVYQIPSLNFIPDAAHCKKARIPHKLYNKYTSYMNHIETSKVLQTYDAMICTQGIYFGLFSRKPYAAVSFGGDLWFEASRDDMLGHIQREAFKNAGVILASDPLTLASCRRYQFNNAIYIPHYLDQNKYSPGPSPFRQEWQDQSGGEFFIFTSARLDKNVKGSALAIEASIQFLKQHAYARLVLIGWGNHKDELIRLLREHNILQQVILLPMSGKERLIQYLRSCDCFLGQFILGAYGHADLEALACGLPTITYVEDRYYNYLCETGSPPVMKAQTTQQIKQHLDTLQDLQVRKQISKTSREWFVNNHGSEKLYIDHAAILVALAKGKRFNFKPSILNSKLSEVERAYHYQGLLSAPQFPNYIM